MLVACAQVVSLCARLVRQPGVIAAEASRRVQGYASSPELQVRQGWGVQAMLPSCNHLSRV